MKIKLSDIRVNNIFNPKRVKNDNYYIILDVFYDELLNQIRIINNISHECECMVLVIGSKTKEILKIYGFDLVEEKGDD